MNTREVIDRYYELANAGDWDAWCDLFTDAMVMDEQLAGHIEGLDTLITPETLSGPRYPAATQKEINTEQFAHE